MSLTFTNAVPAFAPQSEPVSTDPLLGAMQADLAADHSSGPMRLNAVEVWLSDQSHQVLVDPSVHGEVLTGFFPDDLEVPVHIRGSAIVSWRWTSAPEDD